MAAQTRSPAGGSLLRLLLARPYLVTGILAGAIVFVATAPWLTRPVTRALLGWNTGVIVFLGLTLIYMSGADIARIKQKAIEHDEGGRFIFILTVLAAVASIGALAAELAAAKGLHASAFHIALAAGTVVFSWLFVQIVFAMHYAHVYYLAAENNQPQRGLSFGECGEPDYWDFVHFSLVLGATSQTADITFTSKAMRRIGTLHTLVAFGFNTAILATMINLAAGLF